MIKEVLVRLDGTAADEARLAAAGGIARTFESCIIGLLLNIIPPPPPADPEGIGLTQGALLMQKALQAGDALEALLTPRLNALGPPVELRRIDVVSDEIPSVCAREARTSDTFVALRPGSGPGELDDVVESVLFGSGRHLFLVPESKWATPSFEHVLIGWNGSREAARAVAEATPFLNRARAVTICVVVERYPEDALLGPDMERHLHRHGIAAVVNHVRPGKDGAGQKLISQARRLKADLIVAGGYGHSQMREWLLGGTTYELLHHAPVPLVIAH